MRLIYHPDAEAELIEAAQFYAERVSELGVQFLDAASLAVAYIQESPNQSSVVESDVRRYLMTRFPFAIYYRLFPDHIRILAFKHHSRHPDYWRNRLID